ncbi:unnamed protein product, partial [Sphacelaria rigidula]
MNGGNKLGTQPVACSVSDTSKQSDTRDGRLSTSPADLQESPKACPGKEHVGEGSTGAAENSKVTASGSHGHRARPSTPASKSDECVPFRRSTRQAGIRRPSPSKNMSAPPQVKKKSTGAPLNQQPWPSDRRGVRCKFKGCSEPPSYSFDGRRPAVRCGNHRDVGAKMYRVEHIGAKICGKKGCGRPATTSYMSQDGRIVRRCSEHTQSDVAALTTATRCQYEECMAEPRYGAKKGPLSFCNDHKRVGMFTVRHGQLMIATRDGSAHLRREALSEQIEAATATYATAASTAAAAAVTTTS